MLSPSSLGRLLRRLHAVRSRDPVPEELRGWSWWSPPLRPRAHLGLGVGEAAIRWCPSRRDLHLRRVRGLEPQPTQAMLRGRVVHGAFRRSALDVARLHVLGRDPPGIVAELVASAGDAARAIAEEAGALGLEELAARAYTRFVFLWSGWVEETGQPPWYTEYVVDGSLLGLSPRLRVDALGVGIVVEVKLGAWRDDYPAALAGYALALEASHEIPVDYGLVLLVSRDASRIEPRPVYLGADERIAFIEARDEAIELLLSGQDPGAPSECTRGCPFARLCAPAAAPARGGEALGEALA
ncbi:type I-A CRISPR-associated protein Cas4/Csa1 [Pyrodictium abyssi]